MKLWNGMNLYQEIRTFKIYDIVLLAENNGDKNVFLAF